MKLNLKIYWDKLDNKFALVILLLTVLCGFFGFGTKPWQSWEAAAVIFTLVYTLTLYYFEGFFKKSFWKKLGIEKIGYLVLGIFLILASTSVVIWFLINNLIHEYNANYIKFDRWAIMGMLCITAIVLSGMDYLIGNAETDNSLRHIIMFYYSDLPITAIFLVLFLYSLKLKFCGNVQMDSFFSGAIAFQMMLSNIIWTLTDNVINIVFNKQKTP